MSSYQNSILLSALSFKPSRRMPSSDSGRYGAEIAGISKRKLQKGCHHQHSSSLASYYLCFCVLCVAPFLMFSFRDYCNFGAIVSGVRTSVKFPSHSYTVKFPVNAPRHRPEPDDVRNHLVCPNSCAASSCDTRDARAGPRGISDARNACAAVRGSLTRGMHARRRAESIASKMASGWPIRRPCMEASIRNRP